MILEFEVLNLAYPGLFGPGGPGGLDSKEFY